MIGFDTSMAVTTACVMPDGGEPVRTPPPTPERLLGPPGHSAELLPPLARLLERAGPGGTRSTAIAVASGPARSPGCGSGSRPRAALAQALGVPLHPVSSLAALAAGLRRRTRSPGRRCCR